MAMKQEKIHDRIAQELPVNSVVSVAIVTDPYSDKGEKIQVLRSERDDPLAGMLSRRQIDQAQFEAGRRFQFLHECSTIGVIRAIDPCKEAVDGGRLPEFLTDLQIRAFKELAQAYRELTPGQNHLVFSILIERQQISKLAAELGAKTAYQTKIVGAHFRGALESLAMFWGLTTRKTA